MIIAITDLDMTADYDIVKQEFNGVWDIALACNHQVVSNLVRVRLQTEINWELFAENPQIDDSILAQQIRKVIDTTYGVASSDLTDFRRTYDGRNVLLSKICFTVDCNNSQECFTL